MRVLGFDTSTDLLTMAVVDDGQVVGELAMRDPRGPTESLVLLLGRFLEHLGLTVRDMDGLAVGTGPGSWTGTRVGVITGKVLAFATGKPATGVSSFDALVYGCGIQEGTVCVLSGFGRDRVFCADYRLHLGAYRRVTDYAAMGLEEMIQSTRKGTVFIGPGARRHRRELSAVTGSVVLSRFASPPGSCVALLGHHALVAGSGGDPDALMPTYVALPQAEVSIPPREPGR